MNKNTHLKYLALLLFAGSVAVAPAYGQSSGNSWQYSAGINLWGAGVKGTTRNGTKIDVGLSDLLDNLDFTFMGMLEARKARWSLLGDVVYLGLSADQGATLPAGGGQVRGRFDVDVDGLVLNLLSGYNLSDTDDGRVDVYFGARYLDMDTNLALTIGDASRGTAATGDIWDGVVGLRGRVNLKERWYLPYSVDIGAGQSDLTWQAIGGVAYNYNWGDLSFAYRHIEWELDADSPISDINFSGPGIQAKWYF